MDVYQVVERNCCVSLGERSRNGWFIYTFHIMAYGWERCRGSPT
jgi:hypothetical protein